jgi:hypothetical protein
MAFPGIYNISYYKGDTHEFRVYPKDSSGAIFDLTGYGNVKFTIANTRGAGSTKVEAFAQISEDKTFLTCAILPGNGALLSSDISYVYDIEISKTSSPYNYVYTLLTGTITVTEQVTGS